MCAMIALCWLRLAGDPPWYNLVGEFTDEAFYTANVQCVFKAGRWQAGYLDQSWSSPILQGILLVWGGIFGVGFAAIKGLNALVASFTLIASAWFARKHYGARAAMLLVAALGFNSVFFIVRKTFCPEAFHLLLITTAYFLLLGGRRRDFFLSGLCLALAVGVKLSGFYALPGAGLFVLWKFWRKRMFFADMVVFGLPMAVAFSAYGVTYIIMRDRWAMSIEQQALQINLLRETIATRLFAVFTAAVLTSDLGAMLPAIAAGVWIVRAAIVEKSFFNFKDPQPESERVILLLFWILTPVLIGLVNPEYMNRRLLPLLVPLCLLAVLPVPKYPKKGVRMRPRGSGAFSASDLWLLMALMHAFYAAYMMFWCLNVNYVFAYHLRFDDFNTPTATDSERLCLLAASAAVGLLVLFAETTPNMLLLRRMRQTGIVLYLGWWLLVSGWCIINPTYTIAEASASLGKYTRRGDMMGFIQSEANQGFVLCMNNDAVPYFVAGNHPEQATARPEGLRLRLLSRTIERRTAWEWQMVPRISEFYSLKLETAPIFLDLVPMPFGRFSHRIEVVVLKDE
ncbi:MAG TPA: hypothetical protein PL033_00095 [Candidatus Brocadiia bacterium]|nr:hypothetical protein [Candidatus Brocadiia bacterium]